MIVLAVVVLALVAVGLRARSGGHDADQNTAATAAGVPVAAPGEPAAAPGGEGNRGSRGEGGPRRSFVERLGEQLELTEEQKAEAAKLQEQFGPRMTAVREDTTLDDTQRRAQFREVMEEQTEAFRALLTPEQQKKMEELQAERTRNFGGGGGPGGPSGGEARQGGPGEGGARGGEARQGGPSRGSQGETRQGGPGGPGGSQGNRQSWSDRLAGELQLTDDQKAQYEKIQSDFDAKRQALRGDESLSNDDRRAKQRALRDEQTAAVKEILTPEQQQKMDELQAERTRNFGGGPGGPGGGEARQGGRGDGGPRGEGRPRGGRPGGDGGEGGGAPTGG